LVRTVVHEIFPYLPAVSQRINEAGFPLAI
jgi:hypothetical protein